MLEPCEQGGSPAPDGDPKSSNDPLARSPGLSKLAEFVACVKSVRVLHNFKRERISTQEG